MMSTSCRGGCGCVSAGWKVSWKPSGAVDSPASTSGRTNFGSVVSIIALGF